MYLFVHGINSYIIRNKNHATNSIYYIYKYSILFKI